MLEYILIAVFIVAIYLTIRKERKPFFNKWFVFLTPAVFIVYSVVLKRSEMKLISTIWLSVFMAFMISALIANFPDWFRKIFGKKNKNNSYDPDKKT